MSDERWIAQLFETGAEKEPHRRCAIGQPDAAEPPIQLRVPVRDTSVPMSDPERRYSSVMYGLFYFDAEARVANYSWEPSGDKEAT